MYWIIEDIDVNNTKNITQNLNGGGGGLRTAEKRLTLPPFRQVLNMRAFVSLFICVFI
jgi:hypothetical protein